MDKTVFTIGHSKRSIEKFLRCLGDSAIELLIDVRTYPRSKRNPHFAQHELPDSLKEAGIAYRWSGKALGGLRKLREPNPHTALSETGASAYAAHMSTQIFRQEIDEILRLSENQATCMMCAEADPAKCHRQFIADYLLVAGYSVQHLDYSGGSRTHKLSVALNIENGHLVYNKNSQQRLF
ncbi:MAG: DUF488 domain-containing protein [Gammaproteobacteria bacterium]